MKFLLDYNFTDEEIENLSGNIPPLLLEGIFNSYRLVSKNLDYIKDMGVRNYKEVFTKFYDMFLMDNSNFKNIFAKYDKSDLVDKIEANADIIEFL